MEKLPDLYQQYGFPGVEKFFKITNNLNLNITKQQIENFIKHQDVKQKFANDTNKHYDYPIRSLHYMFECQIDLLDMSKFSFYNKMGSTYKWIFTAVDVWSRKAFCYALKNKNIHTVVLSGREDDSVIEEAYTLGCHDFLSKPFIYTNSSFLIKRKTPIESSSAPMMKFAHIAVRLSGVPMISTTHANK
jgi:hypothetical protein